MFLLTAPGPVKGIRYTPQSRSELTVAAPFKQDISVARGVIMSFYCTVVDYSGDTVVQIRSFTTVDDDVYCVDEESLNDITGEDLFDFTFTGLSEINLGLLLASLNCLNIFFTCTCTYTRCRNTLQRDSVWHKFSWQWITQPFLCLHRGGK